MPIKIKEVRETSRFYQMIPHEGEPFDILFVFDEQQGEWALQPPEAVITCRGTKGVRYSQDEWKHIGKIFEELNAMTEKDTPKKKVVRKTTKAKK